MTRSERLRPVLAAYGDPILQLGPLGAGQWVKLVNNTLFAAQIGLVAEACGWARARRSRRGRLLERARRTAAARAASVEIAGPGLGARRSSRRSASSSARTSPWCARPSPSSAATWVYSKGCST